MKYKYEHEPNFTTKQVGLTRWVGPDDKQMHPLARENKDKWCIECGCPAWLHYNNASVNCVGICYSDNKGNSHGKCKGLVVYTLEFFVNQARKS